MLNSFYSFIRSRLFRMDAEQAHHLSLAVLRLTNRLGMGKLFHPALVRAPRTVMGLRFDNPVGLAAGLDKDGICIDALAAFGFGFIEVGTVTPRAQPGNPRPRLFRLPAADALINRLGFNNGGVDALVRNVQASRYKGILGINLGKNADTPIDQAAQDYLYCLERVYPFASYVTVNISSPNTQNLRQLQQGDALDALLAALHNKREQLADLHGKRVPIAIKVAPDLTDADIQSISAALLRHRMDGLIATNTTLSRAAVAGIEHADQAGGLSGKPLLETSNNVIRKFHQELGNTIPIIGVGGIFSGADARAKLDAGASLVQIYTGLIYRGPTLVHECAQALAQYARAQR